MKRRFKKTHRTVYDVDLQITALADILMVVLIFLLKSYSSGVDTIKDVTYQEEIRLPQVSRGDLDENGLRVEIGKNGVRVDGAEVAPLHNYRFPASDLNKDLSDNGTSNRLLRALASQRKRVKGEAKVWLISDKRTPYATVQTVLASAAIKGYSDIKLLVVKEDL